MTSTINLTTSTLNSDWISEEDKPDPTGLRPTGWKIVVRPLSVRNKTKGGVYMPDKMVGDVAYLMTVGRVLAIGPLAYTRNDLLQPVTDEEGRIVGHKVAPWCKPGDFVTYGKFAGAKRVFKGVKLLMLNDDEVIDVIDDPKDIDPLFNLSS